MDSGKELLKNKMLTIVLGCGSLQFEESCESRVEDLVITKSSITSSILKFCNSGPNLSNQLREY